MKDTTYRVQIYGGDVGDLDLDFEDIASEEEAMALARKEHPKGARPTEVYEITGEGDDGFEDARIIAWVD